MVDGLPLGKVLALGVLLVGAACSAPPSTVQPGGCPSACSPGFTCQDGACLVLCNPPCRLGYACVIRGGVTQCDALPDGAAINTPSTDAAVDAPMPPPPADVPVTTDPRPPATRACPSGAWLRVRVWDVYAMPRQPDGSPWDGLSGPDRELGCGVSSAVVVAALERALGGAFPGGALFADYVRARTQAAIAEVCRLGANWLQDRFEGPDMFATGGEGGASIWLTPAVQDAWAAALRTTTRGATAEWAVPCGGGTHSQLVVDDEDFAKDDRMGAIAFSLGDLTPQMICAGWARLRPFGGVASVVMRIQVDGAGQNCEGLLPTSMAEVTFPRDPMTPAGSNPTATAESGSPRAQ